MNHAVQNHRPQQHLPKRVLLVIVAGISLLFAIGINGVWLSSKDDNYAEYRALFDQDKVISNALSDYHSRDRQDERLNDKLFRNRKGGFFLEVLSHEGVENSNTFFFENKLSWHGILVVSNPDLIPQIKSSRSANVFNLCLSSRPGTVSFIPSKGHSPLNMSTPIDPKNDVENKIEVPCETVTTLMQQKRIWHVDLFSLKADGWTELSVLEGIDFKGIEIDVIIIERALSGNFTRAVKGERLREYGRLLEPHGYFLAFPLPIRCTWEETCIGVVIVRRGANVELQPLRDKRTSTSLPYRSQHGQDEYLNENLFLNQTEGFFLEAGALDGVHTSNTYFFEKHLSWRGLLVEPTPNFIPQIKFSRSADVFHGCVSSRPGTMSFIPGKVSGHGQLSVSRHENPKEASFLAPADKTIDVPCQTVTTLLQERGVRHVDLFSLDVEGFELSVLEGLNFNEIEIDVILVEAALPHDFRNPKIGERLRQYRNVLEPHGYFVASSLPTGCTWGYSCLDIVFVRRGSAVAAHATKQDPSKHMTSALKKRYLASVQVQQNISNAKIGSDSLETTPMTGLS